METYFKLKLLNGPLQGQELRLPSGPITLGSGESDVLLPLEQGGQATLEVTASGVSLCSSTPCWVAGRRHGEGPLPIHMGIDLAGIHFVLSKAEEDPPLALIARRRSTHGLLPMGLMLGTLLILFCVGISLWPTKPEPVIYPRDWLPEALQTELGLHAHWLGDNTLKLGGRCRESKNLMSLTERLERAGVRVYQEAICDDDLLRAVKAQLTSYNYQDMTVTLSGEAEALIDGSFQGDTRDLANALDNIPGLNGWKLSDSSVPELRYLITQLKQTNLLGGLSARRTEHAWLLSGRLAPEQQSRLSELLQHLNEQQVSPDLQQRLRPLRFIGASSNVSELNYLPAPMAGIGGNSDAPYLQLTNGMRLLPGTYVKQGMQVVAVTPDGVSLAGHQSLIFLTLHR